MQRSVNINQNQQVTPTDFNNFGAFPRQSFDALTKDFGGFPTPRYTGMLVEQTSASTVRVGAGRFYKPDGSTYLFDAEGGQTLDFLDNLPAVAKRHAIVLSYGTTIDTDLEPRTFLIDTSTRQTEGREVATESRRQAIISFLLGVENATPTDPAIPSDYVAVARVVLTPAGIESITMLLANQVTSLRDAEEDLTAINSRLSQVGPQIDTLRTDISGLGQAVRGKAARDDVYHLRKDMARVKDLVRLPDDYSYYAADLFQSDAESDLTHADYSARVKNGLRFAVAAQTYGQIARQNALEPRVTVNDNMMTPVFTSVPRFSALGRDGEYPLTNTTIETVEMRAVKETRTVTQYLGSEVTYNYYAPGTVFQRNGETLTAVSNTYEYVFTGGGGSSSGNGSISETTGSDGYDRYTTTWRRSIQYQIEETHWNAVTVPVEIAGSITSQTVLNSQDGYCTSLNLFFTKKSASGDVRVLLCATDAAGKPLLGAVLAEKVLTPADIAVYPNVTKAGIKPTYLQKGNRYALVLVSSAAHFVATLNNDKFAQGAMYNYINGQWVQGSAETDLAFQMEFAHFTNPVVTVQLAPLELAGGIDAITVNADTTIPDGCNIDYQVMVNNVWRSLLEVSRDVSFLASRPALVQFQAVFTGTTDLMPSLGIGARSEVHLLRQADSFVHIAKARNLTAAVDTIEVTLRLRNWDTTNHTCTASLLTGSPAFTTVEAADATVTKPVPGDSTSFDKIFTFSVIDVQNFKIKIAGAKGSAAEYFHVEERVDVEFT